MKVLKIIRYAAYAAIFVIAVIAIARTSYQMADDGENQKLLALSFVDHTGKPWTFEQLDDKVALLYFGYTYCPDVCPTGLASLAQVIEDLGPDGATLVPVFMTVDPERDDPAAMASYIANFGDNFIGLTGSVAQIDAMKTEFGVYSGKTDLRDDGSYLINHSSLVVAIEASGSRATLVDISEPERLMKSIRKSVLFQ